MANDGGGMAGKATGELGGTSGLYGAWQLDVKTPFGQHSATLNLAPDGTGTIDSKIGSVPLTNLQVEGDAFSANVSYPYQGSTYSAKVKGHSTDGHIDGTVNIDLPLAPALKFTGTRQD